MKGERPTIPPLLESYPRVNEMVKACWDTDPANRPTAAEVKELLFEEFPVPQEIKSGLWYTICHYIGRALGFVCLNIDGVV